MEVKRKILLIVSVLLLACSIYGAGRAIAQEQTIKLTDVELGSTTGAATVKSLDYSEDTVNSEIVFHQLDDSVSFAVTFQNNDNYDYSLKDIKAISDDQPNIEYSFTGIGDTFSSSSSKSITISASYVELISNISERELSNSASFTFIFERIEGSYSPNTLDSITTHMVLFIISLAGIIIAIRGKKGLNDKSCAILIVVCAAIAGNSTTADGDTQIVLNANFNFDLASLVNISYDYSTNGGQSTTGEDLVLAYGNDVDLSPSATKSGWNFVGWNTDKDAHTALEGLSADEDITVYAIYAKPLTATFNANNNTLDGESDQSCSLYNNDESCIVDVPAILVTAPNEVIGYTKSANDHSADNAFYSETYNLSTNESFYAQSQKPEITRAIHWDANGATLERHYDDPETGNDSTCVISASYNNTEQDASCYVEMPYIDEGDAYYEYTGFSMDPEDDEPQVYDWEWDMEVDEELDDTTWYAIYSRTYYVSFDENGTILSSIMSDGWPIFWVSPYETSCTATNITKTCSVQAPMMGNTAIGYSTDPDDWENLEIVGDDVEYTPTQSIYLYAQSYKPYERRDIQWVANGAILTGDAGVVCEFPEIHNSDEDQKCIVNPPLVTVPEGYEFKGWGMFNNGGSNGYNKETNELTIYRRNWNETDDLFYAAFTKSVVIDIDANGNSGGNGMYSCTLYGENETCRIFLGTRNPGKGKTWLGYSLNPGRDDIVYAGAQYLDVSESFTLYIQIRNDAKTYTASWDANGNATDFEATSESCTIPETYNGEVQATSCTVDGPTYTPDGSLTYLGYNNSADATTNNDAFNTISNQLTLNSSNTGKTWYLIAQ